ncbi:MAG: hypothetical protein WCK61_05740 [Candidatus Omnitrophota bacterium]
MRRILRSTLLVIIFLLFCVASAFSGEPRKLLIFNSATCHRCVEAKEKIIPAILAEFSNKLAFEYHDIQEIENYKLLLSLQKQYAPDLTLDLPVFFISGRLANGSGNIDMKLRELIKGALSSQASRPKFLNIDLVKHFKSFTPLAISFAGLQDGVNPCAFTVIVFFISFLTMQGYRKREVLLIGLTFIAAVFLTYLLIGLGIFNFLYSLKTTLILSKTLTIVIGAFSIILGFFALYDFIKFKISNDPEGQVLQLPGAIKKRIQAIVGFFHRKDRSADAKAAPHIFKLILSAIISGFLVTLLETVCTGQLYLPTIAYILKATQFKFEAFLYLLLYNVMFILPLILIFILALFGVTSTQFAEFLKKHLAMIKLLMALLFLVLGFVLIKGVL